MDDVEWNVNNEGLFLDAMVGHKPVGVNKYFQMAFICDKFADYLQKDVNSENLWTHLATMYNLEALDEGESLPFPNLEKDFSLPESDYGSWITRKDDEKKGPSNKGRETPKNVKDTVKKDEKPQSSSKSKEVLRRDSKDSKTPVSAKKEVRKESEKSKSKSGKHDGKSRGKFDDTPKPSKRPTRGSLSLKSDDSNGSGKSSPVNVTNIKRRRI